MNSHTWILCTWNRCIDTLSILLFNLINAHFNEGDFIWCREDYYSQNADRYQSHAAITRFVKGWHTIVILKIRARTDYICSTVETFFRDFFEIFSKCFRISKKILKNCFFADGSNTYVDVITTNTRVNRLKTVSLSWLRTVISSLIITKINTSSRLLRKYEANATELLEKISKKSITCMLIHVSDSNKTTQWWISRIERVTFLPNGELHIMYSLLWRCDRTCILWLGYYYFSYEYC